MAPVSFSFGAAGVHVLVSRVLGKNFSWVLDKAAGYSFMHSTPNSVKKSTLGKKKGGEKEKMERLV